MFCKFCGAEIDDNSKFCNKCGKDLSEQVQHPTANEYVRQSSPDIMQLNSTEIYNSKIILKQEKSSSQVIGSCVGIGITAVLFAIFFALYATCDGNFSNNPFSRFNTSELNVIKTLLMIGMISGLVNMIISGIKTAVIKKTFICITEKGVYGSGGSSLYFASKTFTLGYNQITNVTVQGISVIIESGGER